MHRAGLVRLVRMGLVYLLVAAAAALGWLWCALPEQVYLACLSGADNLTALLPELLSQPARRITLEPLLMSVGGHTLRDMAGEEPGSWKSQLEKAGFTVDCQLTGMGRLEIAQRIYARKLRSLIG